MPLSNRVYTFPQLNPLSFHGLPGLLADSLPDNFGNKVINSWLSRQGRSKESFSAIKRLCYMGTRGMGALEYKPAFDLGPSNSEPVEVEQLVKLASDVLLERESERLKADDIRKKALLKFGTSAGGARPKAIIAWNEKTGEVRSGQIDADDGFEHWILKLSGVQKGGGYGKADADDYSLVEYAYYKMALNAGITMRECRLLERENYKHFMTKRFDRISGPHSKLHMQTLAGLAHYDFKKPGAYSYEQAAAICLQLGLKQECLEELFRRMVFNVFSYNCDDHVKNFSFLMNRKGQWTLSPAYDLTFSYRPDSIWINSHQMTIDGKRDNIHQKHCLTQQKL